MKKIKLGIVGLGRAGKGMHLRELEGKEDMFEIAAVCDIEKDRCEEMAEKFGCKTYTTLDAFLKDEDVDVVDIATRSCDHFSHAKMALDAGKIVLLEKPMCCTAEEAKELFKIGEGRLFIRHNRRFEAKFLQVNEIIASGILGDVYLIKLARNSYQRRCDWQTLSEYGGGQLLNWGPHIVDHSLHFCGGGYTKLDSYLQRVAAAGDCEDFIKVLFFGKNGRVVDMEISGGTALKTPEYVLYGTRGTLFDNGETCTLRYIDPAVQLEEIKASHETPAGAKFAASPAVPFITEERVWDKNNLDHIWAALYETVVNGKPYPIKSEEALAVMTTIDEIKKQNIHPIV